MGLADWVQLQQSGGIVAIDTAYGYKDQPAIAAGLRALGKEREDVWFTTKIPPSVFCIAKDPAASVLDLIQQVFPEHQPHAPHPPPSPSSTPHTHTYYTHTHKHTHKQPHTETAAARIDSHAALSSESLCAVG